MESTLGGVTCDSELEGARGSMAGVGDGYGWGRTVPEGVSSKALLRKEFYYGDGRGVVVG